MEFKSTIVSLHDEVLLLLGLVMNITHWPSETQHVILERCRCVIQIKRVLHVDIVYCTQVVLAVDVA